MSIDSTNFASASFLAFTSDPLGARVIPATRNVFPIRRVARRAELLEAPSEELTFREVIVPVDGSPYAEHALPWAIQIATLAGARVRLVHVHQQMERPFHARRLELYREFDGLLREPMEEYVADLTRRIDRASTVTVAPTLIDGHHVTTALSDLAASTSEIVVMATRGRSILGRMLIGSALDAVLQRRQAPILHVRGCTCPVDLTARPSLRHALVPLDGSSGSASIMEHVAALSGLTGGRQTLLRVVQSPGVFTCGDGSSEEARELSENPIFQLDQTAKRWSAKLPQLRTSAVWSDLSPGREILAEAAKPGVDFVAIATRSRGRISRLLRPGVFDQLIRRGRTPILVVKQPNESADPHRPVGNRIAWGN
jgi:nucleotide-binding universal stress UspA family protein